MRRIAYLILLAGSLAALAAVSTQASNGNPNAAVFPRFSHPYGADMATWGERASQWVYAQPLDRSPLFDPTGANCAVAQEGPVWYVARIAGPPVFSGERWCTIPHGKSLLLYIGAVVDTYPCPFDWHPAPGQSLYDFLIADAKFWMDTVDFLEVSLDGRQVNDVMDYRFASDDLFTITGDPSLRLNLDPCITGSPQPAVVDGFFLMFKPLTRGEHTIVVHGTNTIGHDKRFTYHLTIE
ncbi:MAG TPA: hypothetical protein VFL41_04780 [Gaiellaceae bacterium]|nr:hypothetical protein [Gaiellaceae bacterium]HET8653308.1 hypothetical protein [Gaiellaceae bacterium]